jgi:probable HAF family extracellular repeat protein
MAINDAGMAAGTSQISNGYMHAFVSNGGSLQDLGTLGGSSSYAYGINNLGNVVGYSGTGSGQMDGFLDEGGVMYDINALLIDAPGWTITELYGINDSNQVVGVGVLNGVEHAVLLTDPPTAGETTSSSSSTSATPEPAAWICVFAGLGALISRRSYSVCFSASAAPAAPASRASAIMRLASVTCSLATRTSSGRFGSISVFTTTAAIPDASSNDCTDCASISDVVPAD